MRTRGRFIGNWWVAFHPRSFTLRARVCRENENTMPGYWSIWWLWFEASHVPGARELDAERDDSVHCGGPR